MHGRRLCLAAHEVLLLSANKQPMELTTFGLVMNLICHGQQLATRVATECYAILFILWNSA
jgi:hypothetical protein